MSYIKHLKFLWKKLHARWLFVWLPSYFFCIKVGSSMTCTAFIHQGGFTHAPSFLLWHMGSLSSQGKSALWSHLLHYQAREEKLQEQLQAELPGITRTPNQYIYSNTHTHISKCVTKTQCHCFFPPCRVTCHREAEVWLFDSDAISPLFSHTGYEVCTAAVK